MELDFWKNWKIINKINDEPLSTNYLAINNDGKKCIIKYISFSKREDNIQKFIKYGLIKTKNDFTDYSKNKIEEIKKSVKNMEKCNGRPNIVDCYDYIEVPLPNNMGTDFYIQMEYINNINFYFKDKKITKMDIINLGIDICTALQLCKTVKVINGNINFDNIFIGNDGHYKLNIFGVDTIFQNNLNYLEFLAPEIYNKKLKNYTSDIYSLGLIMYAMVCKMNNLNIISTNERFKGVSIPILKNIDIELMEIIKKATEFNIDSRYQNAIDMKNDLLKLVNEKPKIHKKVIVGKSINIINTLDINEAPKIKSKNSNVAIELLKKNRIRTFFKNFFSTNVLAKIVSLVLFFSIVGIFSFNIFYLNKKCDAGFINKNGKCVKGYYYCEDDYMLTENKQCKKIIHSEPAKATYTCKKGYTLAENDNKKICVNNDMRTPKLENVCPDGFILKGKKCEKVESVDAKLMYTCPRGYILVGDKCVDDDSLDATSQYTCPDNYNLQGNKCIRYNSSTIKAEIKYSCGSNGTLNGTICDYAINPQYSYNYPYCLKGRFNRYDRKCHYSESAQTTYYCKNGSSDGRGNCILSANQTIDASIKYTCPSGYEVIGNKCAKINIINASPIYKCLDSMQLQGSKCFTTISADAVEAYTCPPGFIISGPKCLRNDFLTPKTKYTCSKVYKLSGDQCQKYELKPAKAFYEENKGK